MFQNWGTNPFCDQLAKDWSKEAEWTPGSKMALLVFYFLLELSIGQIGWKRLELRTAIYINILS